MTIKEVGEILKVVGSAFAVTTTVIQCVRWFRARRDRRRLEERLGKQRYAVWDVEAYTRYYIEPACQSVDPGGWDEPRRLIAARQPVFSALDQALANQSEYRYIIVLADSGMGKSALLLNYYVRHLRTGKTPFRLQLFPVSGFSEKDVTAMPDHDQVVLFLDALDEDIAANADLKHRLKQILDMTRNLRRVVITCRTQFFSKDDEIPNRTGIIRTGPRAAGKSGEHFFHKLYLSPFSDQQVDQYLRKRYGRLHPKKRKKAAELAKKIPNIAVRPMLLAHIDSLIGTTKVIQHSFQLYEEMIDAWLIREEGIFTGVTKQALREFSERLAMDLYENREARGSEKIPKSEIAALAYHWKIPLEDWQLTGRSLLNRDAEGNFKFAHRSIMEYLFVKRFIAGTESRRFSRWTDQMRAFLLEMIKTGIEVGGLAGVDLAGASLVGCQLAGANLEGADLSGADLQGVNLSGANLQSARLLETNLSHANLAGARLDGADLSSAVLRSAVLKGAVLSGSRLWSADLSAANVSMGQMGGVDATNAVLVEASLDGVSAHEANFRSANMSRASLTSADLKEATLVEANLDGAALNGTKLNSSDIMSATLRGADLSGANLEEANLNGADLGGVKFKGTKLKGAFLQDVKNLAPDEAIRASKAGAHVDQVVGQAQAQPIRSTASPPPRPATPVVHSAHQPVLCHCGSGRYEIDCHGAATVSPAMRPNKFTL